MGYFSWAQGALFLFSIQISGLARTPVINGFGSVVPGNPSSASLLTFIPYFSHYDWFSFYRDSTFKSTKSCFLPPISFRFPPSILEAWILFLLSGFFFFPNDCQVMLLFSDQLGTLSLPLVPNVWLSAKAFFRFPPLVGRTLSEYSPSAFLTMFLDARSPSSDVQYFRRSSTTLSPSPLFSPPRHPQVSVALLRCRCVVFDPSHL